MPRAARLGRPRRRCSSPTSRRSASSCHDVETPVLAKKHMGYPVKQARCTTCHDPHGSSSAGLAVRQRPPAGREGDVLDVPRAGDLEDAAQDAAAGRRALPDVPRAADGEDAREQPRAPAGAGGRVPRLPRPARGRSSAGSSRRTWSSRAAPATRTPSGARSSRRRSTSPSRTASAPSCHDPHGWSAPLLFVNPDADRALRQVPRLAEALDAPDWHRRGRIPRNRNLTLECASCHRAHGTGSKHLLPASEGDRPVHELPREVPEVTSVPDLSTRAAPDRAGREPPRRSARGGAGARPDAPADASTPIAAEVALRSPEGVACDERGALVIADTGNARLLTYTWKEGVLDGGAQVKLAQLTYPVRVQIDSKGFVLALDRRTRRIIRVDAKGAYAGYVEGKGATVADHRRRVQARRRGQRLRPRRRRGEGARRRAGRAPDARAAAARRARAASRTSRRTRAGRSTSSTR